MAVLDEESITKYLQDLNWQKKGNSLVKVVTKDDFAQAIELVNKVAELAQLVNHHPDIDIRWNKVIFDLSSHSEGGITLKDINLAKQIDRITLD